MKLFKAVKSLYLSHIGGSFAAIFLLVPLWAVISRSGVLYSLLTALIHIALIYSSAWRAGDKDGRKIPGYYPDINFAIKIALWGLAFPMLLLAVRFLVPDLWFVDFPIISGEREFLSTGIYFEGTPDLIYKLWYFPYLAYLGNGNILLYLLPILLQTAVVIGGYYVGTKRFRALDYLMQKMMFESKKKDQK